MTTKEFEIQYALGILSEDQKFKMAKNVQTSRRVLSILANDINLAIRIRIHDNPNTPWTTVNMIWNRDRMQIMQSGLV